MKTERAWGWPIALDLFLAGLGGGIVIVSTVADLFFGTGDLFLAASFAATVLLAIGASLLVFELGRPFEFHRVFSRQKAIMTVGAYMLGLLIAVSFAYATFLFSFLPWHAIEGLRQVVAAIGLLLGVGVVVYTGVLPASMKSRPFWHGPALPVLFMVSAISNGIAVQYLLVHVLSSGRDVTVAEGLLTAANIGLLVAEVIVLFIYVLTMRVSSAPPAAQAANSWLKGRQRLAFWVGLVGIGLIAPLVLYAVGMTITWILASAGVLIGGIVLRFLIVYSGDRRLLPGEAEFLAKLPKGDEEFLHAWEGVKS
jgi:formate-dependent nitrite reductase membrane component NrfD